MLDLATDATRTSLRMLTPDYASPEQVTGGRTSTAIDIYALGAVLFKLLTGRSPHQFEDRSPEAIARAVTSGEVVRPSRWAPELKGDLECILLKALRKDPRERYGTVEQFADDLKAFLESRPVRARAADWRYRTRKFVRRYWMLVSAAALVTLSLATGLYIADRQRVVAEQRVAQLRRLSERLLDFETQLTAPNAGSDLELHRKLAATSAQYLESLGPEVLRDRKLALEIGTTYLHIARIEGVPVWNQQGRYEQAKKSLSKVVELASGVLAAEPDNRQALWLVANAAHDRAVIASAERRPEQVSEGAPQVVVGFERLARLGNLTRREINGATYIYGDLADAYTKLDRFEDAVRYARLGIDYSRDEKTVPGPRAQAFNMLAGALQYLGELTGAQAAVQEARRLWEQLRRDEGDTTYTRFILCQTRLQEGLLLGEDGSVNLDRPREGARLLQEGFDAVEAVAQKNANSYDTRMALAEAGHYLGDMLRHLDARRAIAVYDRALAWSREIPTDIAARRMEALLLAGSSYAARRLGRESDARVRIEGAFDVLRKIGDYPAAKIEPRREVFAAMRAQADDDAETGASERAIATEQELRGAIGASKFKADEDLPLAAALSQLDESLAGTLRHAGRNGEAAAVEAERRELWQRWDRKLPNNPFVHRQMAGAARPQ
jgi:tetratricopeptide (TPR) repeat protein